MAYLKPFLRKLLRYRSYDWDSNRVPTKYKQTDIITKTSLIRITEWFSGTKKKINLLASSWLCLLALLTRVNSERICVKYDAEKWAIAFWDSAKHSSAGLNRSDYRIWKCTWQPWCVLSRGRDWVGNPQPRNLQKDSQLCVEFCIVTSSSRNPHPQGYLPQITVSSNREILWFPKGSGIFGRLKHCQLIKNESIPFRHLLHAGGVLRWSHPMKITSTKFKYFPFFA